MCTRTGFWPRGAKSVPEEDGIVSYKSYLVVALLVLGISILGFATTTQAGTQMYSGSLIIQGFGNDTTDGTALSTSRYLQTAAPFGSKRCNHGPARAARTMIFTGNHCPQCNLEAVPNSSSTTTTLMVPAYGGQPAVITQYGGPPIGTEPLYAAGCSITALRAGDPMLAAGTVNTTGAGTGRGFILPAAVFSEQGNGIGDGGGSWPNYTVYYFGIEYFDLKNQAGSFGKNMGPGNFVNTFATGARIAIQEKEGGNKFGGVMQLLGYYGDVEGFYNPTKNRLSIAAFDWEFDKIGGSASTTINGAITKGGLWGTAVNTNQTTGRGAKYISTVKASVFPWTTGTVSITATRGPFPTVMKRTGYDNRNASGVGTIQLVTPMLTRWRQVFDYETGAIGILKLVFTPEPQEWMMLASGVSLLGLLYHANRRRSG